MPQTIHCQRCEADSAARDMADLIGRHTNEKGRAVYVSDRGSS